MVFGDDKSLTRRISVHVSISYCIMHFHQVRYVDSNLDNCFSFENLIFALDCGFSDRPFTVSDKT